MERLEIHISYTCSNNCVFCSEKNRLIRFKNYNLSLLEVERLLMRKRQQGFKHINFTGGEPTLYVDFEKILKIAKNLGYKIYVGSNGIFWSDKSNCERLLPLIDEISLSLHGASQDIHDWHTRHKGSFRQIVSAFDNINEYITNAKAPYFFCNTVITNKNFEQIEGILSFLTNYSQVKQLLISNLAPEGGACANYSKLAVKYSKFNHKVADWINLANQSNLIIRFFGVPLCVLGNNFVYANDLNWDKRVTYELGVDQGEIKLKEKETIFDRKRIKTDVCTDCRCEKICGGIFYRYLELLGNKEIIPIK